MKTIFPPFLVVSNNSFSLFDNFSGSVIAGSELSMGPADFQDFSITGGGSASVLLSSLTIDVNLLSSHSYSVMYTFTSDFINAPVTVFLGAGSVSFAPSQTAVSAFLEVHLIQQ